MRTPTLALLFALLIGALPAQPASAQGTPAFLLRWGSEGPAPGQLDNPQGIATDPQGNVYVADVGNHRIQKFTGNGVFLAAWPILAGDLAIDDAGRIFVTTNADSVPIYDSNFMPIGALHLPHRPLTYLALSPTDDVLYGNSAEDIFSVATDGSSVTSWPFASASGGVANYGFGVGSDGSVCLTVGNQVARYTGSGTLLNYWGEPGTGDGQFTGAKATIVDSQGRVLVSDGNARIQIFALSGSYLGSFGNAGPPAERVSSGVYDMAIDAMGNVFALDVGKHAVFKFGDPATPARPSSWGRLKSLYR